MDVEGRSCRGDGRKGWGFVQESIEAWELVLGCGDRLVVGLISAIAGGKTGWQGSDVASGTWPGCELGI